MSPIVIYDGGRRKRNEFAIAPRLKGKRRNGDLSVSNSLNLGAERSEGREEKGREGKGREGRIKIRGNRTWPQKLALIGIK